jgi:hypothetical protein
VVWWTLGRPRPVRGPRRNRNRIGLRSFPGRPRHLRLVSPSPWARPRSSATAVRQSLSPRLSFSPPSRRQAFPKSRDSAVVPPGFLNVDWRSGFADSNPSSLNVDWRSGFADSNPSSLGGCGLGGVRRGHSESTVGGPSRGVRGDRSHRPFAEAPRARHAGVIGPRPRDRAVIGWRAGGRRVDGVGRQRRRRSDGAAIHELSTHTAHGHAAEGAAAVH